MCSFCSGVSGWALLPFIGEGDAALGRVVLQPLEAAVAHEREVRGDRLQGAGLAQQGYVVGRARDRGADVAQPAALVDDDERLARVRLLLARVVRLLRGVVARPLHPLRGGVDDGHAVRLVRLVRLVRPVRAVHAALGHPPSPAELAAATGLPLGRVDALVAPLPAPVPFDLLVGDDETGTLGDLLPDPAAPRPDDEAAARELTAAVRATLATTLDPRCVGYLAHPGNETARMSQVANTAPIDDAIGARLLEILLDYMLAEATRGTVPLLDDTFDGALSDDERAVRDILRELQTKVPEAIRHTPAWRPVAELLEQLGGPAPPPLDE